MIRSIASVIIGFLAFFIAVILLFWGFGYGFKVAPPSSFLMFSASCQAIFSLGSGYLTALIAKRREVLQAAVLAAIFICIELVSLIFQKQKSPYWMILSLIVINPSCVLLGGYLRKKASDKGSRPMPSLKGGRLAGSLVGDNRGRSLRCPDDRSQDPGMILR